MTIDGDTALHLVCRCPGENGLEMIKLLVEVTNCDVNTRNRNGNTPLIVLIKQNKRQENMSIIKFLLSDCNCDISLSNNDGNTALHVACSSGSVSIVKHILTSISHTIGNNSPYDPALATREKPDCLYSVNNNNEIPLQVAMKAESNRNDIVTLVATEMYKSPDKDGNSPLHLACSMNNLELAKIITGIECDHDKTNK